MKNEDKGENIAYLIKCFPIFLVFVDLIVVVVSFSFNAVKSLFLTRKWFCRDSINAIFIKRNKKKNIPRNIIAIKVLPTTFIWKNQQLGNT